MRQDHERRGGARARQGGTQRSIIERRGQGGHGREGGLIRLRQHERLKRESAMGIGRREVTTESRIKARDNARFTI